MANRIFSERSAGIRATRFSVCLGHFVIFQTRTGALSLDRRIFFLFFSWAILILIAHDG